MVLKVVMEEYQFEKFSYLYRSEAHKEGKTLNGKGRDRETLEGFYIMTDSLHSFQL